MRASCLVLLGLAACSEPHALVTVTARATVPTLASLTVAIAEDDGPVADVTFERGLVFPATFVIATGDQPRTLTLRAEGRDQAGRLRALGEVEVEAGGEVEATLRLDPADQPINAVVLGDQRVSNPDDLIHGGQAIGLGADGGALIVYEDTNRLVARRFGADGQPARNRTTLTDLELPVATRARYATIAAGRDALADRYLLVWDEWPLEGPAGLRWAILDVEGGWRVTATPLASDDGVSRRWVHAAAVPGGWIVVWQEAADASAVTGELRAARVGLTEDRAELGPSVVIADASVPRTMPRVVARGDEALVVWEEPRGGVTRVVGRALDGRGQPRGEPQVLAESGFAPAAVALADGYALAYVELVQGVPRRRLRRIFPDGRLAEPVEVGVARAGGAEDQPTAIVARVDGTITLAWADGDAPESDVDVWGRSFRADGTPCGDAHRLNTTTRGQQRFPDLAPLDGGVLAVWNDGSRSSGDDEDYDAVRGRVVYEDCP